MDDMTQNLGKLSAWQIKEFPETLREDVIRRARQEQITVGEFLTRHIVALRDAGWSFDPGLPVLRHPKPVNVVDLTKVIDMACRVAEFSDRMPKGTRALVNRLVKRQLQDLDAMNPPPMKALPPPSENGLPPEENGLPVTLEIPG